MDSAGDTLSYEFQSTPSMRKETYSCKECGGVTTFQSTPSMRKETSWRQERFMFHVISIHSLHAEGDSNSIHIIT